MTANLYFLGPQRFNKYIPRDPNWKVVFCDDNCAAHGSADTLLILSTVIAQILPPNKAFMIRSCDAGIIAAMKYGIACFKLKVKVTLLR